MTPPNAEGQRDEVVERLLAAGCVAAEEEAAEMLAARPDPGALEGWLRRREDGEPLAWILGQMAFCGRTLRVDRGVYVPRAQTEALARAAADRLPAGGWALDLCTGTGAVAAHLRDAGKGATVIAVDLDRAAAACARANGLTVLVGDLAAALRPGHRFDVVTAVAPYVPTEELQYLPRDVQRHEPMLALDGGGGGLRILLRVIAAAAGVLRPGGWLLAEVGGTQDRALAAPLAAAGFDAADLSYDEDGDLRFFAARYLSEGNSSGSLSLRRSEPRPPDR